MKVVRSTTVSWFDSSLSHVKAVRPEKAMGSTTVSVFEPKESFVKAVSPQAKALGPIAAIWLLER